MKVFVTGANGLLGSNLVRALLAENHEVVALVRASSDVRGLDGLDVEIVRGDVRDPDIMKSAASGCSWMFHLAAVFSYWGFDVDEMQRTAKIGAENAVRAALDAGVERLVFTSSIAAIGGTEEAVAVTEEHALQDADGVPSYFVTKRLQEQTFFDAAAGTDLFIAACNPSLFVGPYDFRPSTSMDTITDYLGDPLRLSIEGGVSVAHAGDIARGHMLVAEKGESGHRYLLGADNWSWKKVHATISELCGLPGPRMCLGRTSAVMGATFMEMGARLFKTKPQATRAMAKQVGKYFWADFSKAKALGYSPRGSRQVLAETLAWLYDSHILSPAMKAKLTMSDEVRLPFAEAQTAGSSA